MSLGQQILITIFFAAILIVGAVVIRWDPFENGHSAVSESLSTRARQQQRLESIIKDTSRYKDFYNRYDLFYSRMTESQRNDLRQIQDRINRDPDGAVLNQMLTTYIAWLKTLTPDDRALIEETSTAQERVAMIRSIKEQQDRIQGLDEGTNGSQRSANRRTGESGIDNMPTDSELAQFIEKMDPRKRQHLLGLPPDEFIYRLLQEYWKDKSQ
ncbi:MAG: hypothetical protein ACRC10_03390 [Thermoguttaceae bacterium]